MNKTLLTFISRIEGELLELEKVVVRAVEAWQRALTKDDDYYIDAAALNLQSFYTGLEKIFTTIASQIDENVPSGSEWHKELLKQMATEINLIRPPIISKELFVKLDDYRGFCNIVRNLYAFSFSKPRIAQLISELPATYENLKKELSAFLEALEASTNTESGQNYSLGKILF